MAAKDRQKAYRERQAKKLADNPNYLADAMVSRTSLERIIARLDGNEKPLAAEIRQMAQEGLA